jgi:hypothetical protein
MNDLAKITKMAQDAANRANAPMAILNLNRYGKLYVVREWQDCYARPADPFGPNYVVVARIEPQQ